MKKVKFKLQNLIFTEKYGLDEHWWLQYRSSEQKPMKYDNIHGCHILPKNETLDCFTYLNSITVRKWRKYTRVEDITLNIKLKGDVIVQMFGHYRESGEIKKEIIKKQIFHCPEVTEISVTYPENIDSEVCAFYLGAINDVEIYSGYYSTSIDVGAIRPLINDFLRKMAKFRYQ